MYFHGTTLSGGESILKTNTFLNSKGNHHWLGDGVYFYKDLEYVFRWIVLKYKDKNNVEWISLNNDVIDNVLREYMILEVELNIDRNRIMSMDDINNKIIFLRIKDELEKYKDNSEKLKNKTIQDAMVINYMFVNLSFGEKYDAVEFNFPIYGGDHKSKILNLSEYQLCVKNKNIIKKITKIDITENGKEILLNKLHDYNSIKFKKYRNNRWKNIYK